MASDRHHPTPDSFPHQWLNESLVMIMTMRENDAAHWDAARLVELARSFSLGALGFSVGGITAFYPTDLSGHDRSPSLGGRDLVAETVQALHSAGIRAIGRIDPSIGSARELAEHPDRFARQADGQPIRLHDAYLTCPSGGHYGRFIIDVVREIVTRYPLDGLWANAAQFSPWSAPRCHCGNCRRLFTEASGLPFPEREDWNDTAWKRYNEWRYQRIADWNRQVRATIQSVRPACAWLPLSQVIESWDHIRKGGWDVDLTSAHADAPVLEAQRRYCNLWWPGMEARYAHAMDPARGAGITVSYFYPWWRFTHAPVAENRVWAAQMVANGARPWLHLTGFFSDRFDRRGIAPMQALFKLFRDRRDVYGPRQSAADVALVYSRRTLDYAGADAPDANYLDAFRGAYNALMDGRVPFDLLSDKAIAGGALSRYRAVLLPNLACLDERTAAAIEAYMHAGGRVVATFRTGFCDEWGEPRAQPWVARWLGARYTGTTQRDLKAAYAVINQPDHPVLAGMGDTDLLPLAGHLCRFEPDGAGDADVLHLIPPVEAYEGSGMSVPEYNTAGVPEAVPLLLTKPIGQGALTYFPWEPDRLGFLFGLRDPMRLLCNALARGDGEPALLRVEGGGLIDVSMMDASDSRVIHLVNFNGASGMRSGHRRAMEDVVPLHGLRISCRLPDRRRCRGLSLTVAGGELSYESIDAGTIRFTLPVLTEFESVRIELD